MKSITLLVLVIVTSPFALSAFVGTLIWYAMKAGYTVANDFVGFILD